MNLPDDSWFSCAEADALEAGGLDELRRQNRRLAIVSQISKSITVNMTYSEIIEKFSLPLREVIPYDLLSFCLLEGDALVIKSGVPKDQEILGIGTVMGEEYYIPWRALRDGRACLRTDIWNDEHQGAEDALLRQLGIRSAVVAPLLVNNEAIGTLNLGYREPYGAADAVYVQQLADQLAVCLQNSRRYQEVFDVKREWERTFHAVQDLLVVVDGDHRIVRANHAHGALGVDDLVGRDCAEVFAFCDDAEGGGPVAETVRTGREAVAEVLDRAGDRVLNVSAYPVPGKQGEVAKVVMCVRDVTAKRKMEAQLFQSAKLAALGEMAAGVAHELNSPLTAVIGNASLLLRRGSPADPSAKMLEDIKACGQRCRKIIQNMLTFARQDSCEFHPLQLNDVVISSIGLVDYQLDKSRITVRKELCEDLPAVIGNAQQLEQVVVNLLLNAKDALGPADSKVVSVSTDYESLDNGELGVAVVVADSGKGMHPQELEKIFNPFFTTKEGDRGTGLGLSVSMGIATNHGGTIRVESKPGAGSTFSLILPQMARQFVDGAARDGGRPAVAAPGVPPAVLEEMRPALRLVRSMGSFQAQLGVEDLRTVEIEYRGKTALGRTRLLTAGMLEGLLSFGPGERVTLVNAAVVARQRGIRVVETASTEGDDYVSLVRLTVETRRGRVGLAGALFGSHEPRLVEVDGIRVEAVPGGNLLVCWAHDRPGLLGSIASILADHDINIGQMRSGHEEPGGRAIDVFNLDHPVGEEVLEELRSRPHLIRVAKVSLP